MSVIDIKLFNILGRDLVIVKTEVQIKSLKSKNLKIWTLVDTKITRATTHPPHNYTTANKYLLAVFPPPQHKTKIKNSFSNT